MGIRGWLLERMFGDIVEGRVQQAVKVIDDKWWREVGRATGPQDRPWWERQTDYQKILQMWRDNPMARRITALTASYVVGDGIKVESRDPGLNDWIKLFWNHRQNRMDQRLTTWCEEISRTGEIFVAVFTNPADGMSYVRLIPAGQIDEIETDGQDLEMERRFHQIGPSPSLSQGERDQRNRMEEGTWWPALELAEAGQPGILHYAINRPPGALRGEGDLGFLAPWLERYANWLRDRAILNHHKSAFVWDVTVPAGMVEQKRMQYKDPPAPGSVIIHDDGESWNATQPNISAWDAKDDGKALRMMVGVGAGIPLHFMSDPEGSTQTTAQEANQPTFKQYGERQRFFTWMLMDLVEQVARRAQGLGRLKLPSPNLSQGERDQRGERDRKGEEGLQLQVRVTDLTEEDNLLLARAAAAIQVALGHLYDKGVMDQETYLGLVLKFAGETTDPREILQKANAEHTARSNGT